MEKPKEIVISIIIIGIIISGVAFYFSGGGPEEKEVNPTSLIKWNEPKPQWKRMSADKWIPPKGIKEIFEHVDTIRSFNDGGMKWDPAAGVNEYMFEKYIKEATGETIDVKLIPVPSASLFEKNLAAWVGKADSPQIMVTHGANMTLTMAKRGDFYEPVKFWTEGTPPEKLMEKLSFRKEVLTKMIRDGNNYIGGISMCGAYGLAYRPAWLRKAGVPESKIPPTNWQDLIDAAEKAREWGKEHLGKGYYGIGLAVGDRSILFRHIMDLVHSQGKMIVKNKKLDFKSEEFETAFRTLVNLIRDDIMSTATMNYGWMDADQTFSVGKSAMNTYTVSKYIEEWSTPEAAPGLWGQSMRSGVREALGVSKNEKDWKFTIPPKWKPESPEEYHSSGSGHFFGIINPFADKWKKAAAQVYLEFKSSKQGGMNEVWVEGNAAAPGVAYDDVNGYIEEYKDEVKEANERGIDKYGHKYTSPLSTKVMGADKIKATWGCCKQELLPRGASDVLSAVLEYYHKSAMGEESIEDALVAIRSAAEDKGILAE